MICNTIITHNEMINSIIMKRRETFYTHSAQLSTLMVPAFSLSAEVLVQGFVGWLSEQGERSGVKGYEAICLCLSTFIVFTRLFAVYVSGAKSKPTNSDKANVQHHKYSQVFIYSLPLIS